jgi:hypothetical protein
MICLPESEPEDCGHAPGGPPQLHAETHAAPRAQDGGEDGRESVRELEGLGDLKYLTEAAH